MNKRASSEPQTLSEGTKKRTLKPKEARFVKGVIAGKSKRRAAMDAAGLSNPGSAAVEANRMLKNATVQEALAAAFERHGLTMDAVIKPVADGLIANKTVIVGEGDVQWQPDHSIRLKAAGMAHNLMGLTRNNEGGNVHFHMHAGTERTDYGGV